MDDKNDVVSLVAVGDVNPIREDIFDPTRSILKGADMVFGQLEAVLSVRGTPQVFQNPPQLNRRLGAAPSAPPLHRPLGDPEAAVKMLVNAGFNVMSFASNHSYNRSEEGVIDTVEALRNNDIAVIGAGKNIDEATRPVIFDKKGNKIGFLGYCSVVIPGGWATSTKAGVAPLRATTSYEQIDWQPGVPPRTISCCNPDDLAGMKDDIRKLRSQVDVLIVSMHWGVHFVPSLIADYQFEAGHAAIDAGADLILGHHAHILKGIEVYKGKPIFYSLCNFSFATASKIPATKASGLYWMNRFGRCIEVDMGLPNYPYPKDTQKTMLVECKIVDKKLKRVAYLPLWMNSKSQPDIVHRSDPRSDEHFRYMQWMCGSQGIDTNFSREEDHVVVLTN